MLLCWPPLLLRRAWTSATTCLYTHVLALQLERQQRLPTPTAGATRVASTTTTAVCTAWLLRVVSGVPMLNRLCQATW